MLKYVFQFCLTITIPLFYLFILYVTWNSAEPFLPLSNITIFGIFLTLLGLFIWIASYISLGKAFGVLPKKQKQIKHGLYRYIPHPMYIGIISTFLGLGISLGSFLGIIITVLFLAPLLILRAFLEDKNLKK